MIAQPEFSGATCVDRPTMFPLLRPSSRPRPRSVYGELRTWTAVIPALENLEALAAYSARDTCRGGQAAERPRARRSPVGEHGGIDARVPEAPLPLADLVCAGARQDDGLGG